MAFQNPPSILGGITRPEVITAPGGGDAMAGGLSAVLAAILQKQQLDQQHQTQQADLAYKQAQTEQELQLAKLTGANTDKATQETKNLKQQGDDLQRKQMYEKVASSFVGQHPELAGNASQFWQTAHQAMEAGALPKDILPELGAAYDTYGKTTEQVGKALKESAQAQSEQAKAPYAGAQAAASLGQTRAETGAAQSLTAVRQQDLRDAKQKAQDTEMQRYLLANDNDPMKAYAKYIVDKKLANTPAGAQQGPALATQFMALSKSPVTGLKPADIRAATTRFDKALKDAGDLKTRGSTIGAAAASLRSAITNPAGYGSAISKFVQAVDQDKNLRYQLLKYYEHNIDPQAPMLLSRFITKNFKGKLPPQMAQDMFQHIVDMRQQYKQQYDNIQNFYAQKYPEAADKFESSDVYFGKDGDFSLGGGAGNPQQSAWDAAAAAIKANPGKYGGKAPEAVLGPRP